MIVIELDVNNIAISAREEPNNYSLKPNELNADHAGDFNSLPFYKKKWTGTEFIEGATPEEIEQMNQIKPNSLLNLHA